MAKESTLPVVIGGGIHIDGTIKGSEPIVLHGRIDGDVTLPEHRLTVEAEARLVGDVDACDVTLRGELAGTAVATETLEIDASARVVGDLRATRLVVADGARISGRIEMTVDLPQGLVAPVVR